MQDPATTPVDQSGSSPTPSTDAPAASQGQNPNNISVKQPGPSYAWQASEYVFHSKSAGWYVILLLITAVLCGVLAFFQQWLSIAVVVVMALAVIIYTRKEPRELNYGIGDGGVEVSGRLMHYGEFRSYSIMEEVSWHSIDLEPAKRFVPRLTLLCENDDIEEIEQILSTHLPREDRQLDWIERATRRLRF
jgi:hypothetical protein